MRASIFGKHSIGDKVILDTLKKSLNIESDYLGYRVDLSKIKPEDHNLIFIINQRLYKIDMDKVLGYIKKDLTKPLMVVHRLKTFAALTFKPNLEIENLTTNKIYVFSGIIYLPKDYMKKTVADIVRTTPKKDWRIYIIK